MAKEGGQAGEGGIYNRPTKRERERERERDLLLNLHIHYRLIN